MVLFILTLSESRIDADGTDVACPSLMQMVRNIGNSFMAHKELEQGLLTAMKGTQVEATAGLSKLVVEKLHACCLIRIVSWLTIFCALLHLSFLSGYVC
jgi:hypothetical protein